jgi:adenylate cyclase
LRIRVLYWLAVLGLLCAAAVLRWADPQPLARVRLVAFDTLQKLQPRQVDPTFPVRIVDIDERSLDAIGAWPWKRDTLARLIERLDALGARVIAFDFVLQRAEPDAASSLPPAVRAAPEMQPLIASLRALPSGDQSLAEAIKRATVTLGVIGRSGASDQIVASRAGFALLGTDPAAYVFRLPAVVGNAPALQVAAAGIGVLNWFPEYDQVVRKVPMLIRLGDALMPSLVAEVVRLSEQTKTVVVRSSTASSETPFVGETGITAVRIGRYQVPTDAAGQMWLSFTPRDGRRSLSAVDVLEGRVARDEITGRIVLVGTSAPGLLDLRATPLEPVVAGVEIHAQAIEQVMAGTMLRRPDLSTGLEVAFTTLAGLLLAFLIRRADPISGAVAGALMLAVVTGAAWWARARLGVLVDPTFAMLALTALYIFCTGFFYFHTTRERNLVRRAFSHYMAPQIVEELARSPDKLRLGGENRTVTLYRSDLAGFSKLSEDLHPQELVVLMNEYLTAMTDIVMAHGGFIDKYIGDAIDGVFGAPADDTDQALHAVKAALESQTKLGEMNAAGSAIMKGRELTQRIGLHTGIGIVGNIGSKRRFNYTVIGDSANLASRLEGANKFYGTAILASEATMQLAGTEIAWREIDTIRVVGRATSVRIYEPVGLAKDITDAQASLMRGYAEGLERWRAADFAGAAERFERGAASDPASRYFLTRCQHYLREPPSGDWDHVHALESK